MQCARFLDRMTQGVVHHERRLKVLNYRLAAIGAPNPFSPLRIARALRGFHAAPEIDSAGSPIFRVVEVVLTNQVGIGAPAGRAPAEVRYDLLPPHAVGQIADDDLRDHDCVPSSLASRWRSVRNFTQWRIRH